MNATWSIEINPADVKASFHFDAADIDKAFFDQADPDEDLWYALTSPDWDEAPVSEKLSILSRVALLVEGAAASQMSITFGTPVLKEG